MTSQISATNHLSLRLSKKDFNLQRMENIYEMAQGKADVPHRHDYYTTVLVDYADGFHSIDYKKYLFDKREVHFVSPGQVHQVINDSQPKGWVITFSKDFLVKNNIPESFISNINLFQRFGETPPLKIDQHTFNRLEIIIREIEACLPLELNYNYRALGALLQVFLIYCNNSKDLNPSQLDEENASICILRNYKQLIDEHYKSWHKVKDYASVMLISPKHLSQTVKNLTGVVAKDHIQNRILLEAKRYLLHTELSVKEIAYEIGFEEPLHFSAFFKKKEGISPSKFRTTTKI